MRLRATAAVLPCALALLGPAVARADHGETVVDPTLAQYMQIAADYWGQVPYCTGPDGEQIPPHAVYAFNPNPFVGAWSELPGCRMWLNTKQWPAPPNEAHCNLIAHEWGHLLGHEHSSDPTDLMWGGGTNLVVPGCRIFRQPESDDPAPEPAHPAVHKRVVRAKAPKRRTRCARAHRTRAHRAARHKAGKRCAPKRTHRQRRS